jgi:Tfp pilus assembly protein PilO
MSLSNYLSYTKVKQSYESLDNKKRLLVIIISMAAIIVLWYFLFILPLQKKSDSVNNQARSKLNNQIKIAQTTIIKLIQATHSPSSDAQESHAIFYNKIKNLYNENKIDTNVDSAIKHLLSNRNGLNISGFQNNKIQIPSNLKTEKSIFQPYEIKLSFKGSFVQMASYLKQFETPKFPIYFKNLYFNVTKYPEGRISLDVLTVVADKKKLDETTRKEPGK